LKDRTALTEALAHYSSAYPEEISFVEDFLKLLQHPRFFYRDHLPGHMTASCWIVDEERSAVLLTHHAKLNRWLQPGGHADGDEDILAVAWKEAREETGLRSLRLLKDSIFDIDIHPIPARKDFPEHLHFDIRFLFSASKDEKFIISEESHDLAWILTDDVQSKTDNNRSMLRMNEKAKKLFRAYQK
jgi:8-oxo-dGTP pyrophosphatase MutT (NUDIX family)